MVKDYFQEITTIQVTKPHKSTINREIGMLLKTRKNNKKTKSLKKKRKRKNRS